MSGLRALATRTLPILIQVTPLLAQDKVEAPVGNASPSPQPYLFYKPKDYGSESQFNPLASFITWSYDTLQVPESFNDFNMSKHWETVRFDLQHPNNAIQRQGGWNAFINRQILPYRGGRADWVPNYSLHLLGGGMVYRKNAEWFEAHGVPYPKLTSALIGTAAELLQETVEDLHQARRRDRRCISFPAPRNAAFQLGSVRALRRGRLAPGGMERAAHL